MTQQRPIGFYVKKLSERIECCVNRELAAHNLTMSQSQLLLLLSDHENGEASMKELENCFHAAQSTICGLVNRMETKGFVQTGIDPQDRRVKIVRLTETGWDMNRICRDGLRELETKLTSQLADEEQAEAIRLLQAMYQAIS